MRLSTTATSRSKARSVFQRIEFSTQSVSAVGTCDSKRLSRSEDLR
jgi:hypothetical protein